MAYTTINKSTDYFNTKLYTGNASTQSITGVGFQPDCTWIKNRDNASNNVIYDVIRTATKRIEPNTTDAEDTKTNGLTSFDSDGFTVGDAVENNGSGNGIVSWNWLASNTTASNTDGSITSTVSVNTTAGFSIVSYTGTGSGATVGHGLGSTPNVIILKNRSSTSGWRVGHLSLGFTKYLSLDATNASITQTNIWNDTTPTSSVFTVGSGSSVNGSGNNIIAYCFAEIPGYSKFGSYTGNGNDDGTFVYTGFKPAWIMIKRTDAVSEWNIYDVKRNPHNLTNLELEANTSDAEANVVEREIDILSNGFKIRGTSTFTNASGGTYIYMAFGQSLVGSNNVPCTAR